MRSPRIWTRSNLNTFAKSCRAGNTCCAGQGRTSSLTGPSPHAINLRTHCTGRSFITVGRRGKLHLRIGERLEALYAGHENEVAAELAEHFEEASDWTRAVKYLRLAAD